MMAARAWEALVTNRFEADTEFNDLIQAFRGEVNKIAPDVSIWPKRKTIPRSWGSLLQTWAGAWCSWDLVRLRRLEKCWPERPGPRGSGLPP